MFHSMHAGSDHESDDSGAQNGRGEKRSMLIMKPRAIMRKSQAWQSCAHAIVAASVVGMPTLPQAVLNLLYV